MRRASIAAIIALAIIVAAVGLAFLPTADDAPAPNQEAGDQPGEIAEYTFTAYETSADLLDQYAGQPLVINFFASWCAPCRAELPDFVDAHAEFGDRVAFVGIDYADPVRQDAIDLLTQTGVTYDIGLDESGTLLDDLSGFAAMPTTIFIGRDGTIVEQHRGIILSDELRSQIEGLLQ